MARCLDFLTGKRGRTPWGTLRIILSSSKSGKKHLASNIFLTTLRNVDSECHRIIVADGFEKLPVAMQFGKGVPTSNETYS